MDAGPDRRPRRSLRLRRSGCGAAKSRKSSISPSFESLLISKDEKSLIRGDTISTPDDELLGRRFSFSMFNKMTGGHSCKNPWRRPFAQTSSFKARHPSSLQSHLSIYSTPSTSQITQAINVEYSVRTQAHDRKLDSLARVTALDQPFVNWNAFAFAVWSTSLRQQVESSVSTTARQESNSGQVRVVVLEPEMEMCRSRRKCQAIAMSRKKSSNRRQDVDALSSIILPPFSTSSPLDRTARLVCARDVYQRHDSPPPPRTRRRPSCSTAGCHGRFLPGPAPSLCLPSTRLEGDAWTQFCLDLHDSVRNATTSFVGQLD